MVKHNKLWVCEKCNHKHHKWVGRCENCKTFQSVVEIKDTLLPKNITGGAGGNKISFFSLEGLDKPNPRLKTNITELDRVCGGGLVSGSSILVGGDPGIGKSTLLLQACSKLKEGSKCIYISGEEAIDQVRLRARRIGLEKKSVLLATETNIKNIIASLKEEKDTDLVVIDSIETMFTDSIDSSPGTVTQVRTCAQELIRVAKNQGFTLFLVGHVTKEGTLAGPRVLEHMVDTVVYFEGDKGHQFRILRAVKNRFGTTDEIGVFEMSSNGLIEVKNTSALFLADRRGKVSGSSVFAGLEGSRTVLMEIQALVASSTGTTPRRNVVGWDQGRLSMIAAVLEARADINLTAQDIYLNVAGGLKISEPAADVAVAASLISSIKDKPCPPQAIMFGEIGLSGEIRAVTQMEHRIKEAEKLGFTQAWIPKQTNKVNKKDYKADTILLEPIGHIRDLAEKFD